MEPFANPIQGFSQGVSGGLQMGLNIKQVQDAKRQQEFQNDLTLATTAMSVAGSKWMTPESAAGVVNKSIIPFIKKYQGVDLPTVTPQSMDGFQPILDRVTKLLKDKNLNEQDKFDQALPMVVEGLAHIGEKQDALKTVLSGLKERGDMTKAGAKGGGSDSPEKIKAELYRKFMAGEKFSPQEQTLFTDAMGGDPLMQQAIQMVNADPMNMTLKPDQKMAKIRSYFGDLQGLQDSSRTPPAPGGPAGMPGGGPPAPNLPDNIRASLQADVQKAATAVQQGTSREEIVAAFKTKYKAYPEIVAQLDGLMKAPMKR